ncbi:hypothetical protein II898_01770 [bacterium]|nr:hypothetical protein [bacterium]
MASRTALVLETNPVITERYLDYTHDSDWRIMLKDTLNDFLEKLQHEKFNLIVAEESLLPQGIIQMMKSTGIPFLLASNNKNPEIPTLPRNFNRTELLTVFDRLVPFVPEDPETEDTMQNTVVDDILSGLEDEEETFELTADAVVTEQTKPVELEEEKQNEAADSVSDFFGDGELFGDDDKAWEKPAEDSGLFDTLKPAVEVSESEKSTISAPPSFDDFSGKSDIDSFVNSLSLEKEEEKPVEADEYKPTITEITPNPLQNEVKSEEKPEKAELSDEMIKAEISAWLDKNARSIIKEIVIEQLASLSGKNND